MDDIIKIYRFGREKMMTEQFSYGEWLYMFDLICSVNDTSDISAFANTLLNQLSRIIAFDQGFVGFASKEKDRIVGKHIAQLNSDWKVLDEYDKNGLHNDPYYNYFYLNKTVVIRDTDIRDENTFCGSDIYKSLYSPLGLYYSLRVNYVYESRLLGYAVLCKAKTSGDFSDKDKAVLEILSDNLNVIFKQKSMLNEEKGSDRKEKNKISRLMKFYDLTPREAQVAEKLSEKCSNTEICDELEITASTLNKHINKLYTKTGAENRATLKKLLAEAGKV